MTGVCDKLQNAPASALNELPDTEMKEQKQPPYAKNQSDNYERPIRQNPPPQRRDASPKPSGGGYGGYSNANNPPSRAPPAKKAGGAAKDSSKPW